jgi:Cu(I)/Ag(I) efflux system membrane fusion protein
MGKRTIILILVLAAIFAIFKFCNNKPEKKAESPEEKQSPLSMGQNSGAFNQSFTSLLSSYYSVKDALVASDTSKVNAAAATLVKNADSLKVNEIQGDTSGMIKETATVFAQTISASSNALLAEKDLEGKRKEFEMITDALWSLTRTVRYDGQKVYYQYCPMAFDNKGAYWLSNTREIRNPYFGDKMPKCGEVADSLDYSKR